MKNIGKDMILFLVVFIFILKGVLYSPFEQVFLRNIINLSQGGQISAAIHDIDSSIDENLSYHKKLMNLESYVLRMTGTRYIQKDDDIIALTNTNLLAGNCMHIEDEGLELAAQKISSLKKITNDNEAEFLYVFAPNKLIDREIPEGLDNYAYDNYLRYIDKLSDNGIEVLDLVQHKKLDNITTEEMFFVTDHHWKPESGFWATEKICNELKYRFDFKYDEDLMNCENYEMTTFEDWFLGSSGKKVGRYFSPLGIDDFTLIIPKFDTHFIEEQPAKQEVKEGDFENTLLYLDELNGKASYYKNPYVVYSGGDYRLQILKNENIVSEDTILIIRDSFAGVVTPFLALHCKELHIVDVRSGSGYIGEKLNMEEYIKKIKPDYVLVLYNSALDGEDSKFNFY